MLVLSISINVPVTTKLSEQVLKEEEISALFKVCEQDLTPTGYRDAALFAILRSGGLRRGEAVKLNLKDFNLSTGAL